MLKQLRHWAAGCACSNIFSRNQIQMQRLSALSSFLREFCCVSSDQFHGELNETFEAYHPRSLKSQIEGQLVQTCEMAPDSSQVMRISRQTNSTKLGSAVGSPRAAKACHRSVSLTCSTEILQDGSALATNFWISEPWIIAALLGCQLTFHTMIPIEK